MDDFNFILYMGTVSIRRGLHGKTKEKFDLNNVAVYQVVAKPLNVVQVLTHSA